MTSLLARDSRADFKAAVQEQASLSQDDSNTLWSGTNKNRDVSTGPLARPFARSLAPLTRSLAPPYSIHSLAHFALSLARGTVID